MRSLLSCELLTRDEHSIGRLVDDFRFQIESTAVSGKHCKIYRKSAIIENIKYPYIFLKDTRLFIVYTFWSYLLCRPFFQYSEMFELLAAQMEHISIGIIWVRMALNQKSNMEILFHLLLLLSMVICFWLPEIYLGARILMPMAVQIQLELLFLWCIVLLNFCLLHHHRICICIYISRSS